MSNTDNKNQSLAASAGKVFINGLLLENPTFVLMLGMCPTLAVTTSAINGMGMGLTTTVVLTLSNIIISLLRKVIPDKVRIPAFIVIIASFVTIVGQFLEAYLPALNESLGMFIPLIVVNCIILGRAESFASKNNFVLSAFDGLGMGLGFTVSLTIIGIVREIIGAHKIFGYSFSAIAANLGAGESVVSWISGLSPISIFVMAPGAFFVLGVLTAIMNSVKQAKEAKGEKTKILSGCGADHDCTNCKESNCEHRFYDVDGKDVAVGLKNNTKKDNTKKDNKEAE